jgi:predicted RNA-binding Zn ribbon-like protein
MATERFQARSAPTGLALVQELVNTHAVARGADPDLLADHASAEGWLRAAADQWARVRGQEPPDLVLPETDVQVLRDLRAVVQELLAVPPDQRPADTSGTPAAVTRRAQVQLVSDEQGRVALVPLGTGGGWLESAVWSEILLAQQTGTWDQVKLCREPGCRSAFYDSSRNGSGTWHNVRTCGNSANLRASRTRKKLRSVAQADADANAGDGSGC